MEQEIRFCTTSDGVRIAYAIVGQGPPLVYGCGWPGHLEVEWENPWAKAFLEELARGFTLIRYDMRSSGLSDRGVSDFSLDALVKDVEAVVDHLALDRFPLLSLGTLAGPIAMTYAAAYPQRVSHLILYSAFLRGSEITTPERQRALVDYTAAFGEPSYGIAGGDDERLKAFREQQVASASRETEAALLRTWFSADVSYLVGRLTMPTLVLHARGDPEVPFALGRELAIRLPQARFVPFEGSTAGPLGVSNVLIPEIHRFLGVEPKAQRPLVTAPAGLVTLLFTDMEGSTNLTQRLGDARAQELLRAHNAIVRDALKAHGGSQIKHTGDGIMASFPSASGAIECAVAIQRALAEQGESNPETPIRVRIGLNAGEPVAEEDDLFGTAVQLTARICGRAEPGQVLCSNVVRELSAGKGYLFSDQGDVELRGFEDPVRLYELRWEA